MTRPFAPIEEAIGAIRAGRMVTQAFGLRPAGGKGPTGLSVLSSL